MKPSNGLMEFWMDGVLGSIGWSNGFYLTQSRKAAMNYVMEQTGLCIKKLHSRTPILHCSNISSIHYSLAPLLQHSITLQFH